MTDSPELYGFLMAVRKYVIHEGVPLLISGMSEGSYINNIAAVRFVPAKEEALPVQHVDGTLEYPDYHRIVFWIDSGDHTMENRKTMVVAWDADRSVSFEQVGETMLENRGKRALKLYDDEVIPIDCLVFVPKHSDSRSLSIDWEEVEL